MKAFNVLILGSVLLVGATAQAGSEAHGGDAVVCFSVPVTKAMDDQGMMTDLGRKSIRYAMTLEWYRINSTPRNKEIIKITGLPYPQAIEALHDQFAGVPNFRAMLWDAYARIGQIPVRGLPANYGLMDIRDSGTFVGLPKDCALVQAAVREQDTVTYDVDVWKKLSPFQQALLQLHEEIYWIGSTYAMTPEWQLYYHSTSNYTQLLILYLLRNENVGPADLGVAIEQYKFGRYLTLAPGAWSPDTPPGWGMNDD